MPTPLPDAESLSFIARLELIARQAVEGFLSGLHPSPYHGSSVEYADHRPYAQGDDLRSIDWKLLAKTDKHYVKLFAEQTNLRATLVVDGSASMRFNSHTTSKLDYACALAASLAYLLLRQHDAAGLAVIDDSLRSFTPARSTGSHFRVLLERLEAALKDQRHETSLAAPLHDLATRLPQRGLIILISDLIDDTAALADALAHFRHQRHEVIVFHLLDPAELSFPYDERTRFTDPESQASLIADGKAVRAGYLNRLAAFLEQTKRICHDRSIGYVQAATDQPLAAMLSTYLERRSRAAARLI